MWRRGGRDLGPDTRTRATLSATHARVVSTIKLLVERDTPTDITAVCRCSRFAVRGCAHVHVALYGTLCGSTYRSGKVVGECWCPQMGGQGAVAVASGVHALRARHVLAAV